MNQALIQLIQMLADIGVTAEASATSLTIRAINSDLLHEWFLWQAQQEALEAWLEEERLRWYGSPEAIQADFHQMVRQAEEAWEEAEAAAAEYDRLEDASFDDWA